jgi:hypothetical protein
LKFNDLDYSNLKTYSLKERKSKVGIDDFAGVHQKGASILKFLDTLPCTLKAKDLNEIINKVVKAKSDGKIVVLAMGAHVIKVGLNPVIIDLMERGVIDAIALNGAGIIHDTELAMIGRTSEDVGAVLKEGNFGMAKETAEFLNGAVLKNDDVSAGLGKVIGDAINSSDLKHKEHSLIGNAARLGIPVTVHIAIGTDIIHMHPDFPVEGFAALSFRDFQIFSSITAELQGGVYFNIGSAVVLPEVFLKSVSLVTNLGHKLEDFTTVNMDFIQHYRPITNVVKRPTTGGGSGYSITGHHEIMIPLLAAGIIEKMQGT